MILPRKQNTKALVYDLEVFPNLTMFVGKVKATGESLTYVSHNNKVIEGDLDSIRNAVNDSVIVGFNNHGYDDRILAGILKGASNEATYAASSMAIRESSRPVSLNSGQCVQSIDLAHLLKTGKRFPSLKAVAQVIHYPVVNDLPLDPDKPVNESDVATLLDYCRHDVEITDLVLEGLRPRHLMRRVLETEFKVVDALNKSDSRVGEEVLINRYCDLASTTERELRDAGYENSPLVQYRYEAPERLKAAARSNATVAGIIEGLEAHDYRVVPKAVDSKGAVKTHQHLNPTTDELFVGGRYVTRGQGGLHTIDVTTDNSALVRPKRGERLIELDVASMYPSIILENGIAPRHFDQEKFLDAYRGLVTSRLEAKRKGDNAKADGLKISINAVYGKLASPFSALYDPKAQTDVTNTGQIALALLMAWVHEAGHQVVTANTDSVTAIVNGDVSEIVERWQDATGLVLEETEFDWILLDNVSDRAMKVKGGEMKYKGKFSLAPSMTKKLNPAIVTKSVINFILNKEPVDQYINRQDDIREFLTSVNTHKRERKTVGDEVLQKNSRLYHSTNGFPVRSESASRENVTESDDKFSTLPVIQEVDNLDKSVYIAEAQAKVDSIVPWVGTFTEDAKELTDRGFVPMPLRANGMNFKGQSGRISTKKPKTEDYSIAGSLGVYTGVNANNVICLDVDEPGTVPSEVRRLIAESDGVFCWSTNEGDPTATLEEVKAALVNGKPRGKVKVLYRSDFASNLPGKVRRKSHSGSYGKRRLFGGALEVFYGEKVNVLGKSVRGNKRRFYTLSDNAPGKLPGSLFGIVAEQFEPKAIRERVEYEVNRAGSTLTDKSLDLLEEFLKSRGMNVFDRDAYGIKGHCLVHDHAHPSKDEYKVGIRDDGSLWHKCFKEDAGSVQALNDAWFEFQAEKRKPREDRQAYFSKLREEEQRVRELVYDDEDALIIKAPPRTGKTGGVIASIVTHPQDGTLNVVVAKDKADMYAIEERLGKVPTTLEKENAYLLNQENRLTKAHNNADTIITHWTYLNAMGHSGEQFALLRLLRDRRAQGDKVIVNIDEFDAFIHKSRVVIPFDGRRLRNSGEFQSRKYTHKCAYYTRAGNCGICEFVEGALYADPFNKHTGGNVATLVNWDNSQSAKRYDPAFKVPLSVLEELNLGPMTSGDALPTQFVQHIRQDTPKAPDVDNVGQTSEKLFHDPAEVFHNLVRSLDGASIVTKKPVCKENLEPVNPEEIGEGKRFDSGDVYFPADACGVRQLTGVYLGGLRALKDMGAKIRLLSATYTPETLENVNAAMGNVRIEKVGSLSKQITKTMVVVTPDKVCPFTKHGEVINEQFRLPGGLVFANQFKDHDIRNRAVGTRIKSSPMWKDQAVQIIGPDGDLAGSSQHFTSRDRRINFSLLSVKGGYSRGQNWEFSKFAMMPLAPTYPGILYSDAESGEDLLRRRSEDAKSDAVQALFRIMSKHEDEEQSFRVLLIHEVDSMFVNKSGKPNVTFIEEELNLITENFEVYYVNNEDAINRVLEAAGEFLRTGEFPEGMPNDLITDEVTETFDYFREKLENGIQWSHVYSKYRVKQKLSALGWDNESINKFNKAMGWAYNNGGTDGALSELDSFYQLREAA